MKLCAHTNGESYIPVAQQVEILKNNGFESVMIFWYQDAYDNPPQVAAAKAQEIGLRIENCHIPFWGAEDLWSPEGGDVEKMILRCLDEISHYETEKVVLHVSAWLKETRLTEVGLERIKRILNKAEGLGLEVAIENICEAHVLDYIFERIQSPALKFCYDNGHEMIFSKDEDLLMKYADRVIALHLTDNDGQEDQHYLPFDGVFDWTKLMEKLEKIHYDGPLAFEVGWHCGPDHPLKDGDQYIKELKRRIKELK